jgi:hypothetical protein
MTKTWLDRFPAEIIFMIFDYLSSNEIIYTFFFCSQRMNNLLLQNQHYLNYLELPTTDFDTWEPILSIIGCRIHTLNVTTIDLSFPLNYFSNLKSLIISCPYQFPEKELQLIFESDQFQNLHSFQLKENEMFPFKSAYNFSIHGQNSLKKIFNSKSLLKTFEYSLRISSSTIYPTDSFQINVNLHSLTLILSNFGDIFTVISYTPNLEYLNVRSNPPIDISRHHYIMNIIFKRSFKEEYKSKQITYKQFYLTLYKPGFGDIDIDRLFDRIKLSFPSLNCLSLNLLSIPIRSMNEFPLNSIKLQQFLEPMIELKQFHLCANISRIPQNILSEFQNQFWFDRDLSFGTDYRNYFYTLPFHFDYPQEFPVDFNTVKSNNPDILQI